MTKKTPKDADRLIQEVMAEIGWDADPADIAEQVRRLDIGLPVEDEFAVVCALAREVSPPAQARSSTIAGGFA
ncbi:hypothetical protein [Rhizobium laguerreae]|uniref:hypothetical protein n=1 Tax=Rhizobium laguerreae TaxID=1076926 RepID=UPI001FE21DF4|nr:hypothetical protein [Rhizobium laguerreae]